MDWLERAHLVASSVSEFNVIRCFLIECIVQICWLKKPDILQAVRGKFKSHLYQYMAFGCGHFEHL